MKLGLAMELRLAMELGLAMKWVSGEMKDWARWLGSVGRSVSSVEDWARWI